MYIYVYVYLERMKCTWYTYILLIVVGIVRAIGSEDCPVRQLELSRQLISLTVYLSINWNCPGNIYNHSVVRPSPATHSCTIIIMFKVNNK